VLNIVCITLLVTSVMLLHNAINAYRRSFFNQFALAIASY